MTLLVARRVTDGQIFDVAVAAFAQRLNVLQTRVNPFDVLAAQPARHLAMQLAGDGFVDFQAGVG